MFEKFFTIVVIPQKTSAVRKIRIPLFVFVLSVLLVVGLVSAWSWMIYDYLSIRSQLINIDQTKSSFQEKKKQIEEFNKKYESVQMHFEHLKSINFKLRQLTNLERNKKSKRVQKTTEEKHAQQKRASSDGILSVIASNADEIDPNLNDEGIKFSRLTTFFKETESPLNRVPMGWPAKGILMNEYGVRTDPVTNQMISNYGISIVTSNNAPVHSTASGLVLYAGKDENFDNLLTLDHGNGYITRYGYLGTIEAEAGDLVEKGDVIAQMSNTEQAAGSHLYYEVSLNHITQNPIKYIE